MTLRCGCSQSCACVLSAGDCTVVGGNGNPAAPYQVSLVVDPAVDNQAVCGIAGLYVPPATVSVADTNCINLNGTGDPGSPITADPVISPDAANLLGCVVAPNPNPGLRAIITTTDSDCIDISGDGTVASPLTADLISSPDANNTFECRANGVYVPSVALGTMDRATIQMYAAQAVPASAGAGIPSSVPILYDTATEDTAAFIDVSTGSMRFVVPPGLAGYYLIGMVERDDAGGTNLNTTVGIQIRVNGVVVSSNRFDRMLATQKIMECCRQVTLAVGDLIEGYFNITDPAGATAIHPLGPGGIGFPRYLQLVRLSPA